MNTPTQSQEISSQARDAKRPRAPQPADLIRIDGALLKLETVARIAGRGVSTLYLDASKERGLLVLTKVGPRCTRVKSEDARAYLQRLAGGAQ